MASEFDIVIRGGTVMDGNGGTPFVGDVAVKDGKIAEVGKVSGRGAEEINAGGLAVTPGFVDIHTHYDGQAMWDSCLAPSSWHGVTTVVMGNCGVGFAPVRKDTQDAVIALMEGVEDIPGPCLHEGLDWSGRVSPNTSPRWSAVATTSTSAHCCRTRRCGSMSWVTAR